MTLDPQTHLEESSKPSIFKRNKLARQSTKDRLGTKTERTAGTAALGLDHLSEYEDYLDLDKTNVIKQDVNKLRALNQSGAAQGFNSVVGGIVSGLATAVEDLSYLGDLESHAKRIAGMDDWERNWLAEAMIDFKKGVDETLPIYRESSETFDWSDPGFYWGSLKGILDSAVGFAIPGGIIAKGTSAALKASRASKLIELATKSEKGIRIAEAFGAGAVQNYAEGRMMGLETYENTMDSFKSLIDNGSLTISEAERLSGEAANQMLVNNTALILTDAFGLYGLTKGVGTTRNILKEKGFKNRFKNFGETLVAPNADNIILQGAKEAGEEITQNVIQMEAEYQAQKKAGMDVSDVPSSMLDRMYHFASSDQALLEGMMGFFGGGPQRILSELTSGQFIKTAKEAYRNRVNEQNRVIGENADYLSKSASLDSEKIKDRDDLYSKGENALGDAVDMTIFDNIAIRNFAAGTTENLETRLNNIASGNLTEEEKANLDENAKQKVSNYISRLKVLENEYIRHASKPNVSQIVRNRSNYEYTKRTLADLDTKISTKASEVQEYIDNVFVPEGYSYDFSTLEKNPYDKTKEAGSYKNYNKFIDEVSNLDDYKDLKILQEFRKDVTSRIANLQKEYSYLKTPEAGIAFLNDQKDIADQIAKEKEEAKKEEDIEVTNVTPGGKYKDAAGTTWEFVGEDEEGNIKMKKATYKKGVYEKFTPTQFAKKFVKDSGTITQKVNEDVLESTKKEEGTKEASRETKAKEKAGESLTEEEQQVAKTLTATKHDELSEEPSNEEFEEEVIEIDSKAKNPAALAWLSTNNKDVEGGDENITNFLENRKNDIIGKKVRIRLNKPFTDLNDFNAFLNREKLSKDKLDALKERLIKNGALQVDILNDDGTVITENNTPISLYIHLPDYRPEAEYNEEMSQFREEIIDELLSSPHARSSVSSTIIEKTGGTIQRGTNENVKTVLAEDDANKIMLFVRTETGDLSGGVDSRSGDKLFDPEMDKFRNPKAPKGTVFAKVKMANNTPFPLRLNVSNLSNVEAELVYEIYSVLLNKEIPFNQFLEETPLKTMIENSSPRIANILKVLPKNSTALDLLNELVYNGEYTLDGKFPLHLENGRVLYGTGNNGKPNFFTFSNREAKKEEFINWLVINKTRNINFKKLNDTAYKSYLINNHILESNALYNENGPVFAQPTIIIKNTTSKEMIPVQEEVDLETGQPISIVRLPKEFLADDDTPSNEKDLDKQEVKVTNEDIDFFVAEMKSKYGNQAVEAAGSFKEFYNFMLELEGNEEATFRAAKKQFEDTIKDCL